MASEPTKAKPVTTPPGTTNLEENIRACTDEVSAILRKYDMNIIVQSVPVIMPNRAETKSDLKV